MSREVPGHDEDRGVAQRKANPAKYMDLTYAQKALGTP